MLAKRATEALAGMGALARAGLGAPPSSLNVEIGPHRRFDWVRADLGLLKKIKDELGGTLNDVVLTIVTGALRRFLTERGESTEGLELRAMVPVSVRPSEERGMTGNRVAAMMAPLPVFEPDPVERLRILRRVMAGLKSGKQAVGANVLTELSGFAPPTVMAQAARLQARQRLFNLVVTNVPGPQIELFVLGRKLIDVFPLAPLAKRQSLCVAVMSYNGKINFGLLADYDSVPDLDILVRSVQESIDELRAAAGIKARPAKVRAARAKAKAPAASNPNGAGSAS
jgi:WS/DGAT/MGAT family acyltransferase